MTHRRARAAYDQGHDLPNSKRPLGMKHGVPRTCVLARESPNSTVSTHYARWLRYRVLVKHDPASSVH